MSNEYKHGRSAYLKYQCRCTVCVDANKAYRLQYGRSDFPLDVEVFIQRLIADGRAASIGTSLISKWRKRGFDVFLGDKWAVKLGYHPYEIWGDDFYQGCDGYVKV